MTDYRVEYRWNSAQPLPLLLVTVSGRLLADPRSLPQIIDQAHHVVDQHKDCEAVCLAYDLTRTEGRLPLHALMCRSVLSDKVRRVVVIGARARRDEMSVLIMAAAKRLPYEIDFFGTLEEAYPALGQQSAAQGTAG